MAKRNPGLNALIRQNAKVQRMLMRRIAGGGGTMSHAGSQGRRTEAAIRKEALAAHIAAQVAAAETRNQDLAARIHELRSVLTHSLSASNAIDFDVLRMGDAPPTLALPEPVTRQVPHRTLEDYTALVKLPTLLERVLKSKRFEQQLVAARARHDQDRIVNEELSAWQRSEVARLMGLHSLEVAEFHKRREERNTEITNFERDYFRGQQDAIITYSEMVLKRSTYPEGFPREFTVGFDAGAGMINIDFRLPEAGIVPSVGEFRYIKSRDTIDGKPRKASEAKVLYQDIVSAVALRTIHEVLVADKSTALREVSFNGFVNTFEENTSRVLPVGIISVRTTADDFQKLDLAGMDKTVCLRSLGARISPDPVSIIPVVPFVELRKPTRRLEGPV